jgi:exopolyphosphatase/guanosine-5'-triphosphate,3'-diphosphate pyrophosphatase
MLDPDPHHGRHVAGLALVLFDSSKRAHGLGAAERELLEYAALLHDVGVFVSRFKHHRHSQYLILNSPLPGFEREEVQWIATIARFHRGEPPKLTHRALEGFDPDVRTRIIRLAAILRVADGLDRSRQKIVRRLRLARLRGREVIEIDAGGRDAALDVWAARRKADLWERCFGVALDFRVRGRGRRYRRKHAAESGSFDGVAVGPGRRSFVRAPRIETEARDR